MSNEPFMIPSPGQPGLYYYEGDFSNCPRKLLRATAWPRTEAIEWLLALMRGDAFSHEGSARVDAARAVLEHAQDVRPATVFDVDSSREKPRDWAPPLDRSAATVEPTFVPPPAPGERPHSVFVVEVLHGGAGPAVVAVCASQEVAQRAAAEDAGAPRLVWKSENPSCVSAPHPLAGLSPGGTRYTVTCHGVRVR